MSTEASLSTVMLLGLRAQANLVTTEEEGLSTVGSSEEPPLAQWATQRAGSPPYTK